VYWEEALRRCEESAAIIASKSGVKLSFRFAAGTLFKRWEELNKEEATPGGCATSASVGGWDEERDGGSGDSKRAGSLPLGPVGGPFRAVGGVLVLFSRSERGPEGSACVGRDATTGFGRMWVSVDVDGRGGRMISGCDGDDRFKAGIKSGNEMGGGEGRRDGKERGKEGGK